ncbi:MAG: non-ribosomal peptide synthetase, partial [bacterium]|nr:non-ribosomal peptide synthetase [bacterium]
LAPPRRGDAVAQAAARLLARPALGRGPLLRVACFELGSDEPARLLLVIHHLAVDGVSWRILLEDLQTALRQLAAGTAVELPAKTTSLRRWAEQLAAYAGSEAVREEQSYWLAAAERGAPPLPTDFPDGGNTVATTEVVGVALGAEETRALLRDVPNAYRTRIDDVLLTALVTALAPWTGEDRLLLDLEGHGREEILDDLDLSRTVGWFTSIYPVLLELPADGGPGAALKAIKEQLRAVPSRGVGYGLLRYLGVDALRRRLAARPGAPLSFNYLGQFDQVLPESALFQPAPESAGPESDPGESRRHLVEVNAQVSGGRLRVAWQYSRERHRRATIRELADRYLEALRELVRHACSPEAGGCTPSDFPLARLDQATVDALVGQGRDVEDVYPLSPLQQGMLLLSLAAPDSAVGCERLQCTLGGGDFDPAAFEQAWARVVARHPVLRTGFAWEEQAEPLQRVHRRVELAWRREDWRRLPAAEQDERWRELAEEADRGFDLARAPLM